MIWAHATPANPCPICGKEDWCTYGDKAMLCQRVESKWPANNGGWYHYYGESKPEYIPQAKAAPKRINATELMKGCVNDLATYNFTTLGVSYQSLVDLGTGYSSRHKALAFPMSDGDGNYIGIRLRNSAGFKWAITGGNNGIFLPQVISNYTKIAYLPEGPTNTAALLTIGLFAIGRPNSKSGNEFIKSALKRLGIYRVVIVADNDELKNTKCLKCGGLINNNLCKDCKNNQKTFRPGLEGAIKLKKELGLASVIWMPPSPLKDVRQYLIKGGTKQMIESEIKNKVWKKL